MRLSADIVWLKVIPAVQCAVVRFPCAFNPSPPVCLVVILAFTVIIAEVKQVGTGTPPRMASGVEDKNPVAVPVHRVVAVAIAWLIRAGAVRSAEPDRRRLLNPNRGQQKLRSCAPLGSAARHHHQT